MRWRDGASVAVRCLLIGVMTTNHKLRNMTAGCSRIHRGVDWQNVRLKAGLEDNSAAVTCMQTIPQPQQILFGVYACWTGVCSAVG